MYITNSGSKFVTMHDNRYYMIYIASMAVLFFQELLKMFFPVLFHMVEKVSRACSLSFVVEVHMGDHLVISNDECSVLEVLIREACMQKIIQR